MLGRDPAPGCHRTQCCARQKLAPPHRQSPTGSKACSISQHIFPPTGTPLLDGSISPFWRWESTPSSQIVGLNEVASLLRYNPVNSRPSHLGTPTCGRGVQRGPLWTTDALHGKCSDSPTLPPSRVLRNVLEVRASIAFAAATSDGDAGQLKVEFFRDGTRQISAILPAAGWIRWKADPQPG